MAQYSLPTGTGFGKLADRRAAALSVPNSPMSTAGFNATKDILAMDTYLLANNLGGYYTQARLDTMTANDKVSAIRYQSDAAGLP